MPARDTAPLGAPCWVDLLSSDTESSIRFYGPLLGWTADEPAEGFGGYFNFRKDGVLVAGCMAGQPDSEFTDGWNVYLATDDIAKTLEATPSHGGSIYRPAQPVGDLGIMAYVVDPGGARVGVWQPGAHRGFGILAEPGAPGWFELHTREYEASAAFYREVFRCDTHVMSDTPEFRYTTLAHGDEWLAGILDAGAELPVDAPGGWTVYFGVADTDAALAKVVELGGAVVRPAEDTPYGRLAAATDTTGAGFKLVGPNDAMPARTA